MDTISNARRGALYAQASSTVSPLDLKERPSGPFAAFGLAPPNTLSVFVVRRDRLSNRLTGVMFGMSIHHRGGMRPIGRSRLF